MVAKEGDLAVLEDVHDEDDELFVMGALEEAVEDVGSPLEGLVEFGGELEGLLNDLDRELLGLDDPEVLGLEGFFAVALGEMQLEGLALGDLVEDFVHLRDLVERVEEGVEEILVPEALDEGEDDHGDGVRLVGVAAED